MRFRRSTKRLISRVDLTPLVDCVFLLLIFFALSSTFILQPGVKVNLPETVVSEFQRSENQLVTITKDGFIFLNGEEVDMQTLAERLSIFAKERAASLLIIEADRKVPYGAVVSVMDVAKRAGVKNLAFATQPKEKSE